ncbi:PREDICTED: ras-related protein O-RAL-like [Nicrophorus vespilloides]|uniref:Ras-related protein O-RAL-like n=1 Tax=Nicrophorus vespilloides TaxID=110193 RepID=A0ABM1MA70_NICVS|nr:PREDICTED: ras-related protein O-RAL-like [Nicrophorus vespilloides]XP_017771471.1 PREDICTED: ras-related protein O-RAL-like [Nicrophorus vespilloides]
MTEANQEDNEIAQDDAIDDTGAGNIVDEEEEDEYVPEPPRPSYHIVLVGDQGIGKSAFNLRFFYDEYVDCYDPNKTDTYSKCYDLDGEAIQIQVLDTLGADDSPATRSAYFRNGEGFIMMFGLNNVASFKSIQEYRKELLKVRESVDIPLILVGNKSDVPSERKVSCDEAQQLALKWGCRYFETSAKTRDNVDEAFYDLLRLVKIQKY